MNETYEAIERLLSDLITANPPLVFSKVISIFLETRHCFSGRRRRSQSINLWLEYSGSIWFESFKCAVGRYLIIQKKKKVGSLDILQCVFMSGYLARVVWDEPLEFLSPAQVSWMNKVAC